MNTDDDIAGLPALYMLPDSRLPDWLAVILVQPMTANTGEIFTLRMPNGN